MYAAAGLVRVLRGLRGHDRDVQHGIDTLRRELETHGRDNAPWRARRAFDVLLLLDAAAWAALLGAIDECPVIHAAIDASRRSGARAISASDFAFISENRQIAAIHEFMESLPAMLSD
jgi:hypothetical protein